MTIMVARHTKDLSQTRQGVRDLDPVGHRRLRNPRRREAGAPCEVCATSEHTTVCNHLLLVAKLGHVCGRKLCSSCVVTVGGTPLCPSHGRLQL